MSKLKLEKKLQRLLSAMADMMSASEAIRCLSRSDKSSHEFLFSSAIINYWRPFTGNKGAGSIFVEFPDYPNGETEEVRAAHEFIKMARNEICAHSSAYAYKISIIPRGSMIPVKNQLANEDTWAFGRRTPVSPEIHDVLVTAINHLSAKLDQVSKPHLQDYISKCGIEGVSELPTWFDISPFDKQRTEEEQVYADQPGIRREPD